MIARCMQIVYAYRSPLCDYVHGKGQLASIGPRGEVSQFPTARANLARNTPLAVMQLIANHAENHPEHPIASCGSASFCWEVDGGTGADAVNTKSRILYA